MSFYPICIWSCESNYNNTYNNTLISDKCTGHHVFFTGLYHLLEDIEGEHFCGNWPLKLYYYCSKVSDYRLILDIFPNFTPTFTW